MFFLAKSKHNQNISYYGELSINGLNTAFKNQIIFKEAPDALDGTKRFKAILRGIERPAFSLTIEGLNACFPELLFSVKYEEGFDLIRFLAKKTSDNIQRERGILPKKIEGQKTPQEVERIKISLYAYAEINKLPIGLIHEFIDFNQNPPKGRLAWQINGEPIKSPQLAFKRFCETKEFKGEVNK